MAKRRRDFTTMTLVSLAIVVWAAAAYFAFSTSKPKPTAAPPSSASAPGPDSALATTLAPSAASASPSATETGGGGAAPSANAVPEESAAPVDSAAPENSAAPDDSAAPENGAPQASATAADGDITACVQAVFPGGSFSWRKPDFSFVCEIADPLKGGTEVRSQLVLGAGQNVTDAMRTWAGLGWYEMAAYSALRGHCCSKPPQLKWAFRLVCTVDESLAKLEAAVARKDGDAVAAAAEAYLKDARCLSQFGQGRNFGQAAPPGAGQAGFKKILAGMGIELP